MKFQTTLLLFVLVVGVGITIYFTSSHGDKSKSSDKVDEHKLVDIDSPDVVGVSITGSDDKHVVLKKTGSAWDLVEPIAARAKASEVDELVRALVGLKSRERLDPSKKASGGLDHPSFVVELTTKDKGTSKLAFGDNSAVGDSLYVLVNTSDKPDVVSNSIYAQLDKPASNYRDMKLVSTPANDVRQLAITNKGKTLRLEKKGDTWEITEPAKMPAEASAVSELVSSITGLEASAYVDAPSAAAKAGLNRPRLTVVYSTQEPSAPAPATQPTTQASVEAELPNAQTIRFGGYKDVLKNDLYASLNGKEVAYVPAASEKTFEKTALDLRDRNVVSIAPDGVTSFTLSINKPATTQPTTRPAELREFAIERRKVVPPTLGPALPGVPATQPSGSTNQPTAITPVASPATQPSTTQPAALAPNTQPTTQPAATGTRSAEFASRQVAYAFASDATAIAPATQPATPTTQPSTPTTQPTEVTAPKSASTELGTHTYTGQTTVGTIGSGTLTISATATIDPSAAIPATQPSTAPTTQPAVATPAAPTTQPAVTATLAPVQTGPITAPLTPSAAPQPPSKWFFASGNTGDADEGQVDALLESFRALRAEKYIEPGVFTGDTYTLVLHTIAKKADESPADYTIIFIDAGTRVIGKYKDLTFEVDRSILEKLAGDFKTKRPASPQHPSFPGAGGPGGPGGFPGGDQ